MVRLSGILSVEALLPNASWRGRAIVVGAALAGVVALGAYQWATFGDPLMTGYQYWLPDVRTFGLDYPFDPRSQRDGSGVVADSLDGALLAWACPCPEDDPLIAFRSIVFYPLVLLGVFWIFTPPLTTIPGMIEVWRRQREAGPGFVLWLTLLTVLFYLIYFYQGARFVAGPATLLAVYSGVAVARWVERRAGMRVAAVATEVPPSQPSPMPAITTRERWEKVRCSASRHVTRVDLAILASLAVLAALPRLTNILGLDPFVDEASWVDWTAHQFDPLVPRSWFAPLLTDGRPPLHFWLSLPVAAVVDNGFVAVRMTAALEGVASTLVLYGLGRELTHSRTAGAVAAILWALTPFSVFFARVAADDALLALTAMLAMWSSVRLARDPTRANAIFCGLSLGLGVLAKTTGLLFVVAPPLAILLLGRPRQWHIYLKPLLVAAAIGVVSILPLLVWFQPVVDQVLVKTPASAANAPGSSLLMRNTEEAIGWLDQLIGRGLPALAALGLVIALIRRQRPLLMVALLGAFWAFAILYRTAPMFSRYLLFTTVPAYLLAGYAVEQVASGLGRILGRLGSGGKPAPAWAQAAISATAILVGLGVALGPRVELLRDVVFDPVHAALPESEHFRYVEQWYAMYGLGQIADELRRRGQEKPVTVLVPTASREDRVLVPHSALRSYLRRDPAIQFLEVPALYRAQDLREIRRVAQNRPTFLVVDGTYLDQPGTSSDAPAYTRRIEERLERDVPNAKEILRVPRPSAPNWLSLYRLDRGD
jgi:4-amino-4-deoxy-L-arabinose transferase-like glycosyltransferase